MQWKEDKPLSQPMDVDSGPASLEDEKDERADWNPEQDYCLKTLVTNYGPHNWVSIAELLNSQSAEKHKTSKQCRERWCNKLDPAINHCPWTKQEEAVLILSHMKFKNRWCDIVANLKGRHNNMIKNRFYSIFRKVKNKLKTNDFSYNSKLELVEIYYMISVMEEYAANPLPEDEPKRKRGRDFMYTLIDDIDQPSLQKYKDDLAKKCPLKSSLEDSLQEMVAAGNPLGCGTTGLRTNTAGRGPVQVQQIRMPSADFGSDPHRTPNSCTTQMDRGGLRMLPEPMSFHPREGLTREEKDFVMSQTFGPRAAMLVMSVPSSGAGYHSSNSEQSAYAWERMKGGFGDFSQAGMQPRIAVVRAIRPVCYMGQGETAGFPPASASTSQPDTGQTQMR